MSLWLIRAGKHGENENLALEQGLAVIGWNELPDLSKVKTREELFELLQKTYPEEKNKTLQNWLSQIWPFIQVMQKGDLVALPLKNRPVIALGEVAGPYMYRPDLPEGARHTRPVKWMAELPRSSFDQDLLYSLGAFMTVCRIQRNNAEERIRALLAGKPVPLKREEPLAAEAEETEAPPDLEQYALDQIFNYIGRKFKGHNLSRLVAAVLEAQGYKVRISPEGPDGGVDIIAGYGPMGFDHPRLIVQVKSSDSPVDIKVMRELQGVMKNFGADHGLLVAWGGFKSSVDKESARLFFDIRLWDAYDLIKNIMANYEKLPEALQAELPLKRIWVLVPTEEE